MMHHARPNPTPAGRHAQGLLLTALAGLAAGTAVAQTSLPIREASIGGGTPNPFGLAYVPWPGSAPVPVSRTGAKAG